MAIKQFYIQLYVERHGANDIGQAYKYSQCIEVNLLRDDVANFISQIPDDLNEHSCISIAVMREDETIISYADGMIAESEGEGWQPAKLLEHNSDLVEAIRQQSKIFAQRRYKRIQKLQQESLLGNDGKILYETLIASFSVYALAGGNKTFLKACLTVRDKRTYRQTAPSPVNAAEGILLPETARNAFRFCRK